MVRGHGAVAQAFASTAPSAVLFIACFYFAKASFGESVGSPLDPVTQKVVRRCLNTPEDAVEKYGGPPGFGFGRCPNLIECVLVESSEATKAGMAAGTSIAALIPTILVLVGLAWGLIAVGSLVAAASSVEVRKKNNGRKVAWRELLGMSYSVRRRGARGAAGASLPLQQQTHGAQTLGTRLNPTNSEDEDNNEMLVVRVEFPNETSWRWWNTFIQAIAVGVYLYATFVLGSTLFLTGYESILYCVCMVLSLSAIRIMSALF
ncbi:MAG: hypothetical protein M1815_001688 [Lichina confinis]|nr:MAG: hypothetical protein M1815_001688 [Lichina confinis]